MDSESKYLKEMVSSLITMGWVQESFGLQKGKVAVIYHHDLKEPKWHLYLTDDHTEYVFVDYNLAKAAWKAFEEFPHNLDLLSAIHSILVSHNDYSIISKKITCICGSIFDDHDQFSGHQPYEYRQYESEDVLNWMSSFGYERYGDLDNCRYTKLGYPSLWDGTLVNRLGDYPDVRGELGLTPERYLIFYYSCLVHNLMGIDIDGSAKNKLEEIKRFKVINSVHNE